MKIYHRLILSPVALACVTIGSSAHAALTYTFEEVANGSGGTDVRISASGTLALDGTSTTPISEIGTNGGLPERIQLESDPSAGEFTFAIFNDTEGYYAFTESTQLIVGVDTSGPTTAFSNNLSGASVSVNSHFGFFATVQGAGVSYAATYTPSQVTSGTTTAPLEITWSPNEQFATAFGTDLATLGLDSFDNTVVYSSLLTQNEIRFNSVPAVPEPSQALLLGITASISLLLRKRRD